MKFLFFCWTLCKILAGTLQPDIFSFFRFIVVTFWTMFIFLNTKWCLFYWFKVDIRALVFLKTKILVKVVMVTEVCRTMVTVWHHYLKTVTVWSASNDIQIRWRIPQFSIDMSNTSSSDIYSKIAIHIFCVFRFKWSFYFQKKNQCLVNKLFENFFVDGNEFWFLTKRMNKLETILDAMLNAIVGRNSLLFE